MIDLSKYPQFNHIVTLKETSRDEHYSGTISYMTDSKLPVINFDDVKNDYIKDLQLSDAPKSCLLYTSSGRNFDEEGIAEQSASAFGGAFPWAGDLGDGRETCQLK